MESWSWVLTPLVVALFGFLFWLVVGKASSSKRDQSQPQGDQEKLPEDPDASIGSGL